MRKSVFLLKKMLRLTPNSPPPFAEVQLPASKSLLNRALIAAALSHAPLPEVARPARDSAILHRILSEKIQKRDAVNVQDAGTVMRFLTAFYTTQGHEVYLYGTARMHERPIGTLVTALKQLGAKIEYAEKEGYPPLRLKGFVNQTSRVQISGKTSSQYISALMLVAPYLPEGLTIELIPPVISWPYIEMTGSLMKQLGAEVLFQETEIKVSPGEYVLSEYNAEPDWSAAGYWYSMLVAGVKSDVLLKGLSLKNSLQGDKKVAEWFERFGVISTETEHGLLLTRPKDVLPTTFEADFTGQPDQAQTFAALCALQEVPAKLTGLQSLRIKETDRIAALAAEITRAGGSVEAGEDYLQIFPKKLQPTTSVRTYDDHRMAMSFACWATKFPGLAIEDEDVVKKSYPLFWEDLSVFFDY